MRQSISASLFLLVFALLFPAGAEGGVRRDYYLAAEDVEWEYAPAGSDLMRSVMIPRIYRERTNWPKTRYIEYTDATFTTRKPQPDWMGILGPVIRGEVGDTIFVHFLNRSKRPQSIHSHGVRYDKGSEGARYNFGGAGGSVRPGAKFTYRWEVLASSGPSPAEPSSKVWLYHGHVDEPMDTNAGLIGPLVITAKGKAKPDGSPKDVQREFPALFMIFDELRGVESGLFHTINGLMHGNLHGFVMNQGERVRWYLMTLGNERDLHTPHWHGQTVITEGTHEDVIMLMPGITRTVDLHAENPGTWMFQCHVSDHMEGGMMTLYTIKHPPRACPVTFENGRFWETAEPFSYDVVNRSSKPIRSVQMLRFVIAGGNKMRGLTHIPWQTAPGDMAPGGRRSSTARAQLHGLKEVEGWAVYPTEVVFADGTKWTSREWSECSYVFWRDLARPQPVLLPPLHGDDEESH